MSPDNKYPRTQSLIDQIQNMCLEDQREVLLALQRAIQTPDKIPLEIPVESHQFLPENPQLSEIIKINSRHKKR